MDRRRQLVEVGAGLLRTGGPTALTSVAVAQKVGIAQSAVYRYVRNMEELTTLATAHLVADLERVQRDILLPPTADPSRLDDFDAVCRGFVQGMVDDADAYDAVDRWRDAGGPLGAAISRMFAQGHEMVASILEHLFRSQFSYTAVFTDAECATQLLHARLIHDDAHSLARMARQNSSASVESLATALAYRARAGWLAYVIDMHDRLGLTLPHVPFVVVPSSDGPNG